MLISMRLIHTMVVAPWNILIEISSCELKDWLSPLALKKICKYYIEKILQTQNQIQLVIIRLIIITQVWGLRQTLL